MFLPPVVLKARRKDPSHWSHPAANWAPPLVAPEAVTCLPLPDASDDCDLWSQHVERQRELQGLPNWQEGETLEASSGDDPEILSPEESKAKQDIWNEVNKDILQFLAASKQRKQLKKKQAEDKRRKAETDCEATEKLHADRLERQRSARSLPRSSGARAESAPEVDASVFDFWQAHSQASSARSVLAQASRAGADSLDVQGSAIVALCPEEAFAAMQQAQEAQAAVSRALREEQEQEAAAERARKRARKVASDVAALFS